MRRGSMPTVCATRASEAHARIALPQIVRYRNAQRITQMPRVTAEIVRVAVFRKAPAMRMPPPGYNVKVK